MKKFILYIILVLGITQLNLSCAPESKIPFLGRMHIVADSLLDAPFPDSLNFGNRGIELSKEQYYALTSDSIEGKRIVAIKQYNDNFLVFFLFEKMWISTILFDKDGKVLDRCTFWGLTPPSCRIAENGRKIMISNTDTLDLNESLWYAKYVEKNKIELKGIFPKNDTIKLFYSVSDRITMIGKQTSKEIAMPSYDIRLLAVSQADRACELASNYRDVPYNGNGCGVYGYKADYAYSELYPFVKCNPQVVLQWIYDHRDNDKIKETLFYCYETYSRYNGGISKEFLRENILKLKGKKAQEYLLNMKVFKEKNVYE